MAKLTPLPYSPDSLGPFLSAKTVSIHHDKHQQAYVDGWNRGLKRLGQARKLQGSDLGRMLRALYENMTYNGSGIILHEMYWENLTPERNKTRPSEALELCITDCFGSPEDFVKEMVGVGLAIQGSGWVVLSWVPRFSRMLILPVREHQINWIPGAVPLLVIDVWEHAYYLDYQSNRLQYLIDIWHYVNWNEVSDRFNQVDTNR